MTIGIYYLQPFFLMMLPRITSALEREQNILGYSILEMQESIPSPRAVPCLNSLCLYVLKIEAVLG